MVRENDYARRRVETLRQKVAGSPEERDPGLDPADRDAIVQFDDQIVSDRMRNQRCGWFHHGNVLATLCILGTEVGGLADSLEESDAGETALDELLAWIHDQNYSGYTIQGMLSDLRVFADAVGDDGMPEHYADIEPSEYVDDDPAPLPSNIVRYRTAVQMAKEMGSSRDQALILLQWDLGLRPMMELYTLKRKNIEFFDDHAIVTLPSQFGKTERRNLMVISGFPALKKWVEDDHPVHDDPEDTMGPETFIWTKQNQNEHLSYGGMAQRFTIAGERAEVEVDHSAQHLRRSSASIMASRPTIGERDLRHRYDWSPYSDAPEHYIAAWAMATQVNVALARGREIEDLDDGQDDDPVLCPHCAEWVTRGFEECHFCGEDVDADELEAAEPLSHPHDDGRNVHRKVIEGEISAADLRSVKRLESELRSNGDELYRQLDPLIDAAERLEDNDDAPTSNALTPVGYGVGLVSEATRPVRRWARKVDATFRLVRDNEYPPSPSTTVGLASTLTLFVGLTTALTLAVAGSLGLEAMTLTLGLGLVIGVARLVAEGAPVGLLPE